MLANRTADQASAFTIPAVDESGTAIVATAAAWELFDARGTTITSAVVAGYAGGDVQFDIAAEHLSLAADESSAGRELAVTLTTASGDVELRDYFLVVSPQPLTLMVNSVLTYPEALALRQEFAKLDGWDVSERTRQAAALAQAYRNLCRMAFKVPGYRADNQSAVGYASFGTGTDSPFFVGRRVRLSTLTLAEFDALPETFQRAVKRAALAEANILLGGDPILDKRKSGMISETVGESSGFFQGKPYLNLPISQPAYEEVKRFVYLSVRVQRS